MLTELKDFFFLPNGGYTDLNISKKVLQKMVNKIDLELKKLCIQIEACQ